MKKTKKTLGEKCLKSFKHYPLVNANKEVKESRKDKYLITTINFSFANQDKNDIDYDKNKPSPITFVFEAISKFELNDVIRTDLKN
jgi:hypothetical protein